MDVVEVLFVSHIVVLDSDEKSPAGTVHFHRKNGLGERFRIEFAPEPKENKAQQSNTWAKPKAGSEQMNHTQTTYIFAKLSATDSCELQAVLSRRSMLMRHSGSLRTAFNCLENSEMRARSSGCAKQGKLAASRSF